MFGLGCYAGSLIIRSSLVSDLLADAKVNALKKVWVKEQGRGGNDFFVCYCVLYKNIQIQKQLII